MSLRRLLLPLLLLCLSLPASANLFDQRPAASPLGAPLNNSSDFLPVREAFKLSLVSSDTQTVTLRFVAAEGYYLYRHRFNFSVEPADLALGEAELPAGQAKHDEFFGDVEVYYGVLDIRLPLDNPDERPLRLQVGYQAAPTRACAIRRRPSSSRSVICRPPAAAMQRQSRQTGTGKNWRCSSSAAWH